MVNLKAMFPSITPPDRYIVTRWRKEEDNVEGRKIMYSTHDARPNDFHVLDLCLICVRFYSMSVRYLLNMSFAQLFTYYMNT